MTEAFHHMRRTQQGWVSTSSSHKNHREKKWRIIAPGAAGGQGYKTYIIWRRSVAMHACRKLCTRVAARLRRVRCAAQGARPPAQPRSPGPLSGLRARLSSRRLARRARPPSAAMRLSASHSTLACARAQDDLIG